MKYSSVPEYFYKFHNRLYALVLIPLLVFVVLYWKMNSGDILPALQDQAFNQVILLTFLLVVLIEWLVSFFVFRRSVKAILTIGSLGERLDRYYTFTLIRFCMNISGLLILATGFYFTRDQYFTILFAASMVAMALAWPTSAKICDDLNLKGEERRLILYKLDKLS